MHITSHHSAAQRNPVQHNPVHRTATQRGAAHQGKSSSDWPNYPGKVSSLGMGTTITPNASQSNTTKEHCNKHDPAGHPQQQSTGLALARKRGRGASA
jgi:hypothetical protein